MKVEKVLQEFPAFERSAIAQVRCPCAQTIPRDEPSIAHPLPRQKGRDIALRCPRRYSRRSRFDRSSAHCTSGDIAARCPYLHERKAAIELFLVKRAIIAPRHPFGQWHPNHPATRILFIVNYQHISDETAVF